MKNRIKRIETISEIKIGDLLYTVDWEYNECLDYVDCIDSGIVYTKGVDGLPTNGERLDTYLDDYMYVYKII